MRTSHQRPRAFTLLELLLVCAIIAILAALLLPALGKAKAKGKRVQCLNNLRQVGIGFHSFAHDHGDKFPMQVSTNGGGSLEFVQAGNAIGGDFYFAFRHLQALSNELGDPKLLVCAADIRMAAADFPTLRNDNVSYFISATADYGKPDSILAGDRNITTGPLGTGPILRIGSNETVAWTAELHEYRGNILFADGRVELLNGAALAGAVSHSPVTQNAFLTPIQAPPNAAADRAPGPRSAAAGTSALARLEGVFPAKPAASGPASIGGATRSPPGGSLPPHENIPEAPQITRTTTNPPIQLSPSAPATPVERTDSVWNEWPLSFAKDLARRASKSTYLLLFILLAILITIEVLRRRRAGKTPTKQ